MEPRERGVHRGGLRRRLRTARPPADAGASGNRRQAAIARDFRAAFPDLRTELDLILGEGDLVAARWTAEGTNTGAWGDRPPTGRRVRFSGVNLFRFGDGKVVELWNHRDDLGVLQQLGAEIFAGAVPTDDDD